jgi:hypothetical protein
MLLPIKDKYLHILISTIVVTIIVLYIRRLNMTTKQVFSHIKSISSNHFNGQPPINRDSLADELNIPKWQLYEYLADLRNAELITFSSGIVMLTELGKRTDTIAD